MTSEFFTGALAYTDLPAWLLGIILIWTLLWKGLALWKSARRNSSIWFVVLLVINTVGILEILYIFLFSELKMDKKRRPTSKSRRTTSSRAKKTTRKPSQPKSKGRR